VATDGTRIACGRGTTIHFGIPGSGPLVRVDLTARVTGGALLGDRLLLVMESGVLESLDLARSRDGVTPAARELLQMLPPQWRPAAIARAGRLLYVAAGDAGILQYLDVTAQAQLHSVTVNNNFFSPRVLNLLPGDSVRWTNSAGFHNVFSCVTGQSGCTAAANETFTSGPGAGPPWIYAYTFQQEGQNPYVCQPHSPAMTGFVNVSEPVVHPPAVPDGTSGTAMTVEQVDAGANTLRVYWDTVTCTGAAGHQIIYGNGSQLPSAPGGAFALSGAICDLGTVAPSVWSDSPDPAGDPSGLLWWLIVATDDSVTEGSWGRDSAGNERVGPESGGSSGQCGVLWKETVEPCGQ
jgi:plastocyanin